MNCNNKLHICRNALKAFMLLKIIQSKISTTTFTQVILL